MKKTEALFLGIIAALGALVVLATALVVMQIFTSESDQTVFLIYFYTPTFIVFSVLVEEFFKYLFISRKIISSILGKSIFLKAALFGSGFALVEAVFIFVGNFPEKNIFFDILKISVIHISTAVIIACIATKKISSWLPKATVILLPVIILHLAYNFAALSENQPLTLFFSGFSFIIAFLILKKMTSSKKHH